jgi:tRNA dimethylallyltransferase
MVSTPGLKKPSVAILTGPTATGKTALALKLIEEGGGPGRFEIINADSLLIYRGMDIGTAKPTAAERAQTPHHLIDVRDPHQAFTAGDFKREAEAAIADIEARDKRALIVGGTGFYLKALIFGLWSAPESDPQILSQLESFTNEDLLRKLRELDPASALRIGVNDRYRLLRALTLIRMTAKTPSELEREQAVQAPDPRFSLWIIDRSNDELFARIDMRTQEMLKNGLIEETRALLENYPEARALDAVGYRETVAFLKGAPPPGRKLRAGVAGLGDEIILGTRQLVKKQRTWFRGQAKTAVNFELGRDLGLVRQAWREIYG